MFYVTFHGYDYASRRAARGVATTPDFVTWFTSGGDLPGDAIFSPDDCNKWNMPWAKGGCIGPGEASIVRAPSGYMYVHTNSQSRVSEHTVDEGTLMFGRCEHAICTMLSAVRGRNELQDTVFIQKRSSNCFHTTSRAMNTSGTAASTSEACYFQNVEGLGQWICFFLYV